jgi:hypothetical protein
MFRAIQADVPRIPDGIRWTYSMMGQGLFEHHPPDGYADTTEAWTNSMSTLYGWNLTIGVIEGWWNDDEDGGRVFVDLPAQTPHELRTATALVDYWIGRVLGRPLPEESRQAIIHFMAGDYGPEDEQEQDHINWRLNTMVALILMSPEFRAR